jgi:hypothetical protein
MYSSPEVTYHKSSTATIFDVNGGDVVKWY